MNTRRNQPEATTYLPRYYQYLIFVTCQKMLQKNKDKKKLRKHWFCVATILFIAMIALGLVGIVFFVTPTTSNQNITDGVGRFFITTVNINLKFALYSAKSFDKELLKRS